VSTKFKDEKSNVATGGFACSPINYLALNYLALKRKQDKKCERNTTFDKLSFCAVFGWDRVNFLQSS